MILDFSSVLVPEFLARLRPDCFSVGPGPPARAFFTNYCVEFPPSNYYFVLLEEEA